MRPMFRESYSGFPSDLDTFKQPCHISCQDTHCLQAFLIIPNFFRGVPMNNIPILRRDNRHVTIGHIFVQLVKSCRTTATSQVAMAADGLPAKCSPLNSSIKNTRSIKDVIKPLAPA